MTTHMSRHSTEPCGLCCGIIDHITRYSNGSAGGSTLADINQPSWHKTTQQIRDSGKFCHLCDTIWQVIILPRLEEVAQDYPNASNLLVSLKFGSHRNANSVHWANVYTCLRADREKFCIMRVDSIGVLLQSQGSPCQYPDWIKSGQDAQDIPRMKEKQINLIKNWLEECQEHHPDCYRPIKPEYFPLRLLDVRKDKLRLVVSKNQPSSELRYATLSHCWGDKLPIFMSRATQDAFGESVPENTLPQTFRDAVQIARSLDISYLWIDALCIVQDDNDEWQNEAAKMQHIYSGSSLTIAASDSRDSTGGCFTHNPSLPSPSIDCVLQSCSEKQDIHTSSKAASTYRSPEGACVVSLDIPRRDSKVMVRVQSGTPWSAQRSKHLSSRGWVLQEQLLSNRVVHCMRSDVHWQCRHTYKTQAGEIIDNDTLLEDGNNFAHRPSKRQERTWCDWMEEYSTRNFTFTGDRIPALTGIMNHHANITGDSHLLGLWKETFARDLLWIRVGDVKGHPCPSIPSWTWLSCYAPIKIDPFTISQLDENPREDHIVLLEGEVTWSGSPMTSRIQSTRLVISGPLQILRFRVDPESKEKFNPPYLHLEGESLDVTDPVPWTCIGQFDAEEPSSGKYTDYPCLLVRTRKHSDQGRFKEAFLILEPVVDAMGEDNKERLPAFRRIGIGCKRGATERTFISANRRVLRLV